MHINAPPALNFSHPSMVIAYLREQLCLMQRGSPYELPPPSADWPSNDVTTQLPRLRMLDAYDETTTAVLQRPRCQSITSTRFPLKPTRADGWQEVSHNDKRSYEATVLGSEVVSHAGTDAYMFADMNRDSLGI